MANAEYILGGDTRAQINERFMEKYPEHYSEICARAAKNNFDLSKCYIATFDIMYRYLAVVYSHCEREGVCLIYTCPLTESPATADVEISNI